MRYRVKSVEIEAWQWNGDTEEEAIKFIKKNKLECAWSFLDGFSDHFYCNYNKTIGLHINTFTGWHLIPKYYYIVKNKDGNYLPCHPEIFEDIYEVVEKGLK